jgi:rubrerythrin
MPKRTGRKPPAVEVTGFVDFAATGDLTAGEFHCADCGYGVIVQRELPRCPMCSGTAWEAGARTPVRGVRGRPR